MSKIETSDSVQKIERLGLAVTMEYRRRRGLLQVMLFLGHRNIKTTLMDTQLIGFARDE
jgi:hypothetical protein